MSEAPNNGRPAEETPEDGARIDVRVGITVGNQPDAVAWVNVPGVVDPVKVPCATIVQDLWDVGEALPENELPGQVLSAEVGRTDNDELILKEFRLTKPLF
ncbi:hypothetical protein GCM10023196_037340 [Actinoallomurus vinaceus]|uniref:DUF35 domain-containing protein n=1 Tax=Actinoallomurus vinaceus TaxID=1080074 RepID=A0ABP8UDZ4_9ACTN